MPRKAKAVQAELLPPEEDSQPKVREIKHKTEWIEVAPVEEAPEGDSADFEDVEIEDKPRKKTRNAIQEMRKKLRAQGVTPVSNLRLYIERYVHSETDAGGSWAETEFCTKYSTTEEHILNKDYIDAARKWGPGKYRITIRMDNRIVDAFDERISAAPSGPVIQHAIPGDPNSPQVIVQSPGDGQQQQPYQPMSMKDIMKSQKEALKEHLEMTKLMREAYGFTPEQSAQQPRSEEEVLTNAILQRPEVLDNVVGSMMKRFGGKAGGGDDEPWYADIVRDAVKSGQAAQVVKTAIDSVFNGVSGLFPKGANNNGQAQMGQTNMANVPSPDSQSPGQGQTQNGQNQSPQALPQGDASVAQTSPDANSQQQQMTPTDQALSTLLNDCRMKLPPEIAYGKLMDFAEAVYDQAPAYSIYPYITYLGNATTDAVIEYVKSLPGGEQIASLPHAKEWTAELQRLIKESQEGEDE